MTVTTPAFLRGETGRTAFAVLVCAGITVGLYLSTIHSYLLFHSLAEMFAVVIAGGIFIVAWNSLIGNAWKYTSKREQPRIEMGLTAGHEPTFYIRDNGAG